MIRSKAIDYEGDKAFLHRCHRTKKEKCGVVSPKKKILEKIHDREFAWGLQPEVKKFLRI